MGKFLDLSGQVFSNLSVKSYVGKRRWLCVCECGKESIVLSYHLKSGHTKSCGCRITSMLQIRNTTHKKSRTSEYNIWCGIKKRCQNPAFKFYSYYGGRGIKICDRWSESFENFLCDMGKKPYPEATIDRIDTNGDYSPKNCRWASRTENNRNRKNSKFIEFNGEKIPYTEAAKRLGVKYSCILDRVSSGWSPEKIMNNRKRKNQYV